MNFLMGNPVHNAQPRRANPRRLGILDVLTTAASFLMD
jgi:hypothetical protein